MLESFLQSSLTLDFHLSTSNKTCHTWSDCFDLENGYCVKGTCYASTAYFHNAMDPGFISYNALWFSYLVTGVNSFAVNENDSVSPLFTEPYWGGYYGDEPYAKVFQV